MKKIRIVSASLLLLAATLSLCAQSQASVADNFSSDSIDKLGRNESAMKQRHGEPLSTQVANIKNPHWSDVIDKTVEYKYENLSFLFYRPSRTPGSAILMNVVVTDPFMKFSSLRIGSKKEEVEKILGCGTPWEDDLVFEDGDGFESVNIRFDKNDRVVKFIFIPYSD
ncbi:MAG: hypothetical protein Q7I97_09110 [Thermovirgaceae bacterium]|nr:hypothetical protein [Thermovirgaceae bacterium]